MTDYSPISKTDDVVETVRETLSAVCTEHREDELDWPGDGHVFEYVTSEDERAIEIVAEPRYRDKDVPPCCDIRMTVRGHTTAVYVITYTGTQTVYMGNTVRVVDALKGLLAKDWCWISDGNPESWMYRVLTDDRYVEED